MRDKPVSVKKAPISAEIIKTIIDKFAGPSANLKDIRVAYICSLGFARFFRYNELSNIAPVHLEFFPDYLRVFVPGSKNDIYREGNYVYIKRLNGEYCPVALIERYISMCNIDLSSSVALFRPVRLFKSTNSYKLYGVKLSYTRCREIFKECLKDIGVDHKLYGLYSLRALPRNFHLRPCKIEKSKIAKLCHNRGLLKPFVERHVSVCLDNCFTFKVTFSFW